MKARDWSLNSQLTLNRARIVHNMYLLQPIDVEPQLLHNRFGFLSRTKRFKLRRVALWFIDTGECVSICVCTVAEN